MPVQKNIYRGKATKTQCPLKRAGSTGTQYTHRYFQSEGKEDAEAGERSGTSLMIAVP